MCFSFRKFPNWCSAIRSTPTILGREMPAAETAASALRIHPLKSSQGCSQELSDAAPQRLTNSSSRCCQFQLATAQRFYTGSSQQPARVLPKQACQPSQSPDHRPALYLLFSTLPCTRPSPAVLHSSTLFPSACHLETYQMPLVS